MKSILYILSILLMGAAAFFAYDSKVKLDNEISTYNQRHAENTNVSAAITKNQGDLDDLDLAVKAAKDKNSVLTETKSNEVAKAGGLRASIEKLNTIKDMEAKLAEFAEAQKEVEKLLEGNVAFRDIEGEIAKIEGERRAQQKKLDELLLLEEKLQKAVAANREEMTRLVTRLDEIHQKMSRNSAQGMVTAVDPVWGFVIVNLGENNSNITPQSDLLISRNGLLVGTVKVSSLEPNQSICDLDLRTLKRGRRIQPGDSVIIAETPGS